MSKEAEYEPGDLYLRLVLSAWLEDQPELKGRCASEIACRAMTEGAIPPYPTAQRMFERLFPLVEEWLSGEEVSPLPS